MGLMKKKRVMKPRRNVGAAGRARRLERRKARKKKATGGAMLVAKPN